MSDSETTPIGEIRTISTAVSTRKLQRSDGGGRRFRRGAWSEAWRWAIVLTITGVLGIGLLLGSLISAIYLQARSDEATTVDAIVILGTAQYNGVPSPDLKARLDQALDAYQHGLAPFIVVTGGKMEGDNYTEAETSKSYLVDAGVPEDAFLMEDQGRSSWQSMQGAAAVLDAAGLHRVLIVSDGFHIFRLKLMAEELGLSAVGIAAEESPIEQNSRNELDYVIREAGATVKFIWDEKIR
jgi:uncharacterized SAM-binding protein YcdF (DUF218 family)